MDKSHPKLLLSIIIFITLPCINLYTDPSLYHLFSIVLGLLVGVVLFLKIPRATLDKWLFSKKVSKQQFMRLMLIMGWPLPLPIFILACPLPLPIFINYETADFLLNTNFIFISMTYWMIMILYLAYTLDPFHEK